ncbi:MAG TPA: hypothetical protein DEP35_13005, partial [Deltaproteobacteria bacterium]|nr:hypothetical protein [Deltaproteobacteria bacterium]
MLSRSLVFGGNLLLHESLGEAGQGSKRFRHDGLAAGACAPGARDLAIARKAGPPRNHRRDDRRREGVALPLSSDRARPRGGGLQAMARGATGAQTASPA